MSPDSDMVVVMRRVAGSLAGPVSVEQLLPMITEAARINIANADLTSISVRSKDGILSTVAPTEEVAVQLDELQYEFREGPCFEAVEGVHAQVTSQDLRNDPRWSRFGPRAVDLGVRSQMAIQIDHEGEMMGLNVYSRQVGAFLAPNDLAELFALHAGAALGYARDRDHLAQALQTRADIGKAVGIVMAKFGVGDERAFEFLVRVSQNTNVKLRHVAARIIEMKTDDLDLR